ncbi:hypothetical protein L9F63_002945 [Diploptera punctata]|uniref:CHK kinase-like domain-containing protein n=1 Tax=Diploptera punctata TaxID=6984 RepID=A0AAD7ZQY8_DIPPU|nr:hypothetical protein L9F63_002945 [Diploptera punctata]
MSVNGNSKVILPWLDEENVKSWFRTPIKEIRYLKTQAAGKGDNYLSNLHRLLVRTPGGDEHIVVKCRVDEGPIAQFLLESGIYSKEHRMYQSTLARMEKMLSEALQDDFEPLSPKFYYCCDEFLVIEDLSPRGYKMEDRQKGLDLTQSMSVMKVLGRLHAASIKLHELDPNEYKEYHVNFFSEPSTFSIWETCFKGWMETFIEELETWPAYEWSYYVEKLRRLHPNFHKKVDETTRRNDSDFNVLAHGDCWINNMMLNGASVRLVDFQSANFTSFAIDLHKFLTTSVQMEVRWKHTDTLIQEYHKSLCSTMAAVKCERKLPTLEEINEEMARKAMYGLFGIVCAAAVMTAAPNTGFDLGELMKGNKPSTRIYSEYFREIVKWGFPLLKDMGIFDRE